MTNPVPSPVIPAPDRRKAGWITAGICLALALLVWAVFGQTLGHDFVSYDDNVIVYENAEVVKGLSLQGVIWAFTHTALGHWDPLTTLSHMLDCQLHGLQPSGHHLTNVILHAFAAVLLFLALREMTSALWRSALVAALFAIHPLRVESVAWVTERKDVLSGVFFMLTLLAYARYTRRPRSLARYLAVVLLFACGLMSKSMLVTLPFVLLLLDYWPLGRFGHATPSRRFLLIEKLPLLGLAVTAAVVQLLANREALSSTDTLPISWRIGNALVSYATYVGQIFWPVNLAVFYPHPMDALPGWKIAGAAAVLLAITFGVAVGARRWPCLPVGWLWYLGMLVPVIGIIQSGSLSSADRYTYLPHIGLYVMIAWSLAAWAQGLQQRQMLLGGCSALALLALSFTAHRQTTYWRNSETLWLHCLKATGSNSIAHQSLFAIYNNLGLAFFAKGQVEEAAAHFEKALAHRPADVGGHDNLGSALFRLGRREEAIAHHEEAVAINPRYEKAQSNLGLALLQTGRVTEAIPHLLKAVEIKPDYTKAHNNLANAYLQTGQIEAAIEHYRKALALKPDYAEAEANLGNALMRQERVEEAIVHYQKAVAIKPDYAKAHGNLGNALLQTKRVAEAVQHYQKALEIQPSYPTVLNNLAWVLATSADSTLRHGGRAVELAGQASQLAGGNAQFAYTLAAAYAEAGRFPEAVQAATRALQLAEAQSDAALAATIRTQIPLFQANMPLRDAP